MKSFDERSLATLVRTVTLALVPIGVLAVSACADGPAMGTSNCPRGDYEKTVPGIVDPGSFDGGLVDDAGTMFYEICSEPSMCGEGAFSCSVVSVDTAAETTKLLCHPECTGRRPSGLIEDGCERGEGVGAWLAEAARLESASIDAFRILREELAHHGAPRSLRRAAGRAARDEVRHARRTSALAARFEGTPRRARVVAGAARTLEEIARENAVEGCTREAYGALVATWQSTNAADPEVRAAMLGIARDERRHAALAFRVARWLEPRLSAESRRRVEEDRERALAELSRETANDPPPELMTTLGVPAAHVACALVEGLRRGR